MRMFIPRPQRQDVRADSAWDHAVFALILAVGFSLRFAWLDAPTLIRDEALGLLAAERSPFYIIARALTSDAHPPYFYFLIKGFLVFGDSVFSLRFFSAASGTAAIWFMRRFVGRIASKESALIASGLIACYFLHIQISRTIRPHPFIVMLTIVSMSFFLDILRKPDTRNLVKIAVINLLLLLFHFNALLVVGTQIALTALFLPGAWNSGARRHYLLFIGISATSMAVNLPLFLLRLGNFPGFDLNISMAWTLERTLVNLDKMMAIVPLEHASLVGWALFLLGSALLLRKDRFAALILLSGVFMPLIVLILVKYGLFYEPWHISFIIPCLLAIIAVAISRLARGPRAARAAALLIPLAGAAFIFSSKHDALYAKSSSLFGYEECVKKVALEIENAEAPQAVLFNRIYELGFANWYVRQSPLGDLRRNSLGPQDKTLGLVLVSNGPIYSDQDNEKEVERLAAKLLADFGAPSGAKDLGCAGIRRWSYPRAPGVALDIPADKVSFSAYPPEFFKYVYRAKDVQAYLSPLQCSLFPSGYDRPGSFTVRFMSASGASLPPADLTLDIFFSNASARNEFKASYAFDGGAQVAAGTANDEGEETLRIRIKRPSRFRTLDVVCAMTASGRYPSFYSVSDSIQFSKMELTATFPAQEAFASDVPLAVSGLSQVERASEGGYRWGMGPETTLRFNLERPEEARLAVALNNPIPGQGVVILANGKPLKRLENLAPQPWLAETTNLELSFPGRRGENVVALRYDRFNGKEAGERPENFARNDGRPLAMAFTMLRVLAPRSAASPLPVRELSPPHSR